MDLNKRLTGIIERNKNENPKFLLDLVKSDFFYLISNYFEVDFNSIEVDFCLVDNKYKICVKCDGDRIKLMHNLPH